MSRVIIAIDPGSPKNRDKSATTGVFVGEYYKPKMIEAFSYTIETKTKQEDENKVASNIEKIVRGYLDSGYLVDIVLEEYINYGYNLAANSFSKNDTSELIGKIKYACPIKINEQSTLLIKTKYKDSILVKLDILEKKNNKWHYTKDFDDKQRLSNRHIRDALRHYLLRRDKLGMLNYVKSLENLFL